MMTMRIAAIVCDNCQGQCMITPMEASTDCSHR